MKGRVLIIAGSDCSGGAGLQADIKTVTALKGYAATAVTALTAQNTTGVFGVYTVPIDFLVQQIEVTLEDVGADCIKTGMLHSAQVIQAVVETLETRAVGVPLVVDPVMVAKGGDSLLEESAVESLKTRLIPKADILTPNIPEAEALSGVDIESLDDMITSAEKLLAMGCKMVLMKGGRGSEAVLKNLLFSGDGYKVFEHPRLNTTSIHGTGDSVASAIAAGIAQGMPVEDAVQRAVDYVFEAVKSAPGFGKGFGPLNHAVNIP